MSFVFLDVWYLLCFTFKFSFSCIHSFLCIWICDLLSVFLIDLHIAHSFTPGLGSLWNISAAECTPGSVLKEQCQIEYCKLIRVFFIIFFLLFFLNPEVYHKTWGERKVSCLLQWHWGLVSWLLSQMLCLNAFVLIFNIQTEVTLFLLNRNNISHWSSHFLFLISCYPWRVIHTTPCMTFFSGLVIHLWQHCYLCISLMGGFESKQTPPFLSFSSTRTRYVFCMHPGQETLSQCF